jgi:putative ATP-dependent endonuclease of OLD family
VASAKTEDTHQPKGRIQVIATTHSPNLASSVGVENIVVLKTTHQIDQAEADEKTTDVTRRVTCALPLARLNLPKNDLRKINQYLDATRAAVLFAKRIILVEGIAEAVLLPVLARHCVFLGDVAMRRKFHAVTIINVGSVDFAPYIRLLLGAIDGLSVMDHLVVITDSDPPVEGGKTKKAVNRPDALRELAQELGAEAKLTVAAATYTLEADLLAEMTNAPVLKAAYLTQHPYRPSQDKWQLITDAAVPAKALYEKLRSDEDFISKGEFAHDVALAIRDGSSFRVPAYLETAIRDSLIELGGPSAAKAQ